MDGEKLIEQEMIGNLEGIKGGQLGSLDRMWVLRRNLAVWSRLLSKQVDAASPAIRVGMRLAGPEVAFL